MVIKKLQNKMKEMLAKKRPGGIKTIITELVLAALIVAIIAGAETPLSTLVNTAITNFQTKFNSILGI